MANSLQDLINRGASRDEINAILSQSTITGDANGISVDGNSLSSLIRPKQLQQIQQPQAQPQRRSFGFAGADGEMFDANNQIPTQRPTHTINDASILRNNPSLLGRNPYESARWLSNAMNNPSNSPQDVQELQAGYRISMGEIERQKQEALQREKLMFDRALQMKQASVKPSDQLAREKFEWEKTQGKPEKPLTEFQGKAALFGSRAAAASDLIDNFGTGDAGSAKTLQYWEDVPLAGRAVNAMTSQTAQQLNQAQKDFVNAVLRLESGATISPAEFANASQQYFPQPGDNPQVVEQKRQNREMAVQGLGKLAGEYGGRYVEEQRAASRNRKPSGDTGGFGDADKESRYQAWKAQQGR